MSYTSTELWLAAQDVPSGGHKSASRSHPDGLFKTPTALAETLYIFDDTVKEPKIPASKWNTAVVIICVTSINGLGSFISGLLVVAIPIIAAELHLGADLILW
jgi:hypothetical protein